jgi:SAM-dependent methyltransferase
VELEDPSEQIAALIELHQGLDRQGPGDAAFTRELLQRLPPLPAHPRIADLGCGSGGGALILAAHYQSVVRAVDLAAPFVEELRTRADQAGIGHLIESIVGDMGALDWSPGGIDLLWSEGAAYQLGFEAALRCWRPLLAESGVAVVSELSWFTNRPAAPALEYWQRNYPGMAGEAENNERAHRAGYRVLANHRLPSAPWWTNYYDPLRRRIDQLSAADSAPGPALRAAIQESLEEMALFERFSDHYGYTFYVLAPSAEREN